MVMQEWGNILCPKIEVEVKQDGDRFLFTVKFNDFSGQLVDTKTYANEVFINGVNLSDQVKQKENNKEKETENYEDKK